MGTAPNSHLFSTLCELLTDAATSVARLAVAIVDTTCDALTSAVKFFCGGWYGQSSKGEGGEAAEVAEGA